MKKPVLSYASLHFQDLRIFGTVNPLSDSYSCRNQVNTYPELISNYFVGNIFLLADVLEPFSLALQIL